MKRYIFLLLWCSGAIVAGQVDDQIKIALAALKRAKAESSQDAVNLVVNDARWIKALAADMDADAAKAEAVRSRIAASLPAGQMGASSGSGGSTNAVQQPRVGGLLGMAIETGAVKDSLNGTTLTLNSSPGKILDFLLGTYGAEADKSSWLNHLERIHITASFNADTQPNGLISLSNFRTAYRQLQELSAKVDLLNHRDLYTTRAGKDLNELMKSPEMRRMLLDVGGLHREFQPILRNAETVIEKLYKASELDEAAIKAELEGLVSDLRRELEKRPDVQQLKKSVRTYRAREEEALSTIARRPVVTLQYVLNRPQLEETPKANDSPKPVSDLGTARLIFLKGLDKSTDFTANTSVSWFNQLRPGMEGRIRDFQANAALTFRSKPTDAVMASFSFVHLRQKPFGVNLVLPNRADVNQPGNIFLGQLRYEKKTGSAISFPISLTFANRTELIKEREVRASVGISVNLDHLIVNTKK